MLVVVNASPWGSSSAAAAFRFTHAAVEAGQQVVAVFFHGDGVYHALPGGMADDGLPDVHHQWRGLAQAHGFELLVCPAASARRGAPAVQQALAPPFRLAGLVELFSRVGSSDRVVGF
ncbi:MAG: hypothetical protein GTN86_05250 [Xanthomonadales bacterium]|nr:hypothetical protein [Xanthomonadales bacterium]NIN59376.1 hypothetical protein [Xanthomonadales bacterium]NIN74727.1 hypothetical protein [Xanthomonadales bacterium]NIP11769.1 hypothetical protein [Xanthomonadales bacterium]NIQ35324.1 hypothetical protein [Xanthomonadales bacterium]